MVVRYIKKTVNKEREKRGGVYVFICNNIWSHNKR